MTAEHPTFEEIRAKLSIEKSQEITVCGKPVQIWGVINYHDSRPAMAGTTSDGYSVIIMNLDVIRLAVKKDKFEQFFKVSLCHEISHLIFQHLVNSGEIDQKFLQNTGNFFSGDATIFNYLRYRYGEEFEKLASITGRDDIILFLDEILATASPLFLGIVSGADEINSLIDPVGQEQLKQKYKIPAVPDNTPSTQQFLIAIDIKLNSNLTLREKLKSIFERHYLFN